MSLVKVEATKVVAPAHAILEVFLSKDLTQLWNPHASEVRHLEDKVQLQTYQLPWPFAAREYLVKCNAVMLPGGGHRTHCYSLDAHPQAPASSDSVRGVSETVWEISPDPEDPKRRSRVLFEGLVDPKGSLPKWIVNEVGKRHTLQLVSKLVRVASERAQKALRRR